jgi:outer membrane murein-binding lipoprotein Lpp
VRDHRNEILRTLLGGLGAPAALAVAGWPSGAAAVALVSLAGVIAGVAIAFLVERLLDREGELSTLRALVQELEDQADAFGRERELLKHQAAVAQMESAVNAVHLDVWAGAYREGLNGGQVPPLAAVLARIEINQRANNLHRPLEPPNPT